MKSKVLIISIGAITVLLFFFLFKKSIFPFAPSTDSLASTASESVIGIFDRDSTLDAQSFSHYTLRLDKQVDEVLLGRLLDKIPAADHLILTILMPAGKYTASAEALQDVSDGDYDAKIEAFCHALKSRKGAVYLRWNPEMEVPVQLYHWQYQAPVDYIEAFNHFAGLCKELLPSVKIVWGAAGYPGADEYWPGSEHVDLVSVTLNGQSEQKATAFPAVKDRVTDLRRKIQRMRFFEKPVLVLHAGSATEQELKTDLAQASNEIQRDAQYLFIDKAKAQLAESGPAAVPLIGVYDPKKMLLNSGLARIEHIFVDLQDVQRGKFERDFHAITSRGHDAIVSIEPWRDSKARKDSSVLNDLIDGIYDEELREIYRIISTTRQMVYLRFAHEMEIPIHRYAWQSQEPALYIRAFRYFMNFDRSQSNHIRKVWGPAGDRGSMEWWPGSDVVDYISIAIYGLPDKNITDPKMQESFEVIYNRKAFRMRMMDKPLFITEFGVKGPEDFQQKWLNDAAEVIRSNPRIKGVCYFNLADNPEVWGDIPAPDWSVSKETFRHFVNRLSEE